MPAESRPWIDRELLFVERVTDVVAEAALTGRLTWCEAYRVVLMAEADREWRRTAWLRFVFAKARRAA
jgi:hypothetical protein